MRFGIDALGDWKWDVLTMKVTRTMYGYEVKKLSFWVFTYFFAEKLETGNYFNCRAILFFLSRGLMRQFPTNTWLVKKRRKRREVKLSTNLNTSF